MPKIAWAEHLYNAYHSVQGDKVYDIRKSIRRKRWMFCTSNIQKSR